MEALHWRNLDQMFWIWDHVKLQTETHFMFSLKKKKCITSLLCLSWEFQVLNTYENQVGFIEELKFGLSNLILVSEVWV